MARETKGQSPVGAVANCKSTDCYASGPIYRVGVAPIEGVGVPVGVLLWCLVADSWMRSKITGAR